MSRDTCDICGGAIVFRYIGGRPTPIHLSGECWAKSGSYGNSSSGYSPGNNKVDLRLLAIELGYSLLVRVFCKDCGQPIYLLAKPDGGFVILDGLSPAWPIHPCYEPSKNRAYPFRHVLSTYTSELDIPVPVNVKWMNSLKEGQIVCATIVKVGGRQSVLCDGKYLYRLIIRGPGRLGECIEGEIIRIGGQWGIQVLKLFECPDNL